MRRRRGHTLLELIASLAMLSFVASVLFSGVMSANRYQEQLKMRALALHAVDNALERIDARDEVTMSWMQAVFAH